MLSGPRTINQIDSKYRVIAQLGQGGTADVSLAVARGPKGFTKLVVLKSMRSQFRTEPEFSEMFMVEARLAARLSHPNVVQTNEVFDFEGLPVIVMEYLEGQALSAISARARGTNSFPSEMHLRVITEALSGLHYSHELAEYDGKPLGVVHRDVSPQNVFLTYDGQVKLLDFGIAKLNGSQVETANGVLKGKLAYMPAEQITGENVDRRCDVYGVGVMLWEAATGQRMWAHATEANIMNAVLNGDVPTPSSVTPDVNPELERIIVKALSVDPDDRHPTAAVLQAELEEFLAGIGSNLKVRDIGTAVSTLFADVREAQQKVIQQQLAHVSALSGSDLEAYQPIELGSFSAISMGSVSQAGPNSRSWKFAWLAVALSLAAAGLFWFSSGTNRATEKAPARDTAPSEVQLRLTAFPREAELLIDGTSLPNPGKRTFARDPTRFVEVVARAPGYKSESRRVELGQNAELLLNLLPLAAPAPTATQATPSKPIKPSTAKPKLPGTVVKPNDCDPPYYIDERGVKKFKRACI